jgi:hypothetical protein
MLRTYVDLDIDDYGAPSTRRTVSVGEVFPIVLYAEHGDAQSEDPIEFDTLILEVFFNDGEDAVVLVNPTDRPVAGELVSSHQESVDAFSREEVRGPERMSMEAVQEASPLTLFGFASLEPAGVYSGRTGRAGIASENGPFVLEAGAPPRAVAMGKATAGLRAERAGKTRLIAYGMALRDGETVPIQAEPSILEIVP